MENKKELLVRIIMGVTIVLLLTTMIMKSDQTNTVAPAPPSVSNDDSLLNVIDSLSTQVVSLESELDQLEKKHDEVVFEYELGLTHIEKIHPDAFKEFHRFIGFKEIYTRETKAENKKRLAKWELTN